MLWGINTGTRGDWLPQVGIQDGQHWPFGNPAPLCCAVAWDKCPNWALLNPLGLRLLPGAAFGGPTYREVESQ